MSGAALSSRAIIGEYYLALEQDIGASWIDGVTNLFQSDQESETYKWLGASPAMREWIGGRHANGSRDNGITIVNKEFEATLEVLVKDLKRDKTGTVMLRVREMAERTNSHWAKLLSTLIVAGEASPCYDGQYFFDTDHAEGESGTQSNDLSAGATAPTAPTAGEFEKAILGSIEAMLGFKDDQGEPMNENAKEFLVMVPVPFMSKAAAALGSQVIVDNSTSRTNNIITVGSLGGFTVRMATNARLPWTTKFATFRTDGQVKSLIRQEEEKVTLSAIAEGSELEFEKKMHKYGVKASRNVGFGYWQRACLSTFQ